MIEFNKGIRVSGMSLWLDSQRSRPLGFISHAHADHTARHQVVIATRATWELCRHRMGPRAKHVALAYHEPYDLEESTIQLFPSGHMLGSAQILIQNGQKIVYTGDLKLKSNLIADPVEIPRCDTLIIECTFGHPKFRFPPADETKRMLIDFIERAFEDRKVPILLAYQMGKSQEVLRLLGNLGYTVCLPKQTLTVVKLYESLGISFERYESMTLGNLFGKVLLLPPYLARSGMIKKIVHRRTAILSGWAIDTHACDRFQVDEAIPFSDHADFYDLMDYVDQAQPDRVYTVHGGPTLASELRKKGCHAQHLAPGTQMDLL